MAERLVLQADGHHAPGPPAWPPGRSRRCRRWPARRPRRRRPRPGRRSPASGGTWASCSASVRSLTCVRSPPPAGELLDHAGHLLAARRRRLSAGCSRSLNESAKTVPTRARPTEAPTWRKKVRLPVATPSRLNGTEAWMTMVKTRERGPDAEAGDEHPDPQHGQLGGRGQAGRTVETHGQQHQRARQKPLVATGAAHEDAAADRADDDAAPSAAAGTGPTRWG